uniref:NADH-ubiquinone oxidoreductase chain 4L n=1 Tax=Euhadra decorata decorata TaxID=244828 RepID=Q75YW1_9EUPU|nr:NADH dehydrogenase subunit 4L [Euhadra decorata decorata]BAC99224.1 NADH dehydrogenase subunit 4L [Euhadra decorata decorata]
MESSYLHTYIVLFCILWSLILLVKKSILMCLISLEFMHFFLFLVFYSPIPPMMGTFTIIVVLLCFAASGAALGLSILVTVSRHSGSDRVSAL